MGSRLNEWTNVLGAPDEPPTGMMKWSEHGLVALTQGNVCGRQWVVTAEIWFDQGHEEPESESDIPYFDGRVVLEGTPIEPKKRYASGWLKNWERKARLPRTQVRGRPRERLVRKGSLQSNRDAQRAVAGLETRRRPASLRSESEAAGRASHRSAARAPPTSHQRFN